MNDGTGGGSPVRSMVNDSQLGATTTLRGSMSGKSLALTVLAFSAPMAVVTGFIPLTIAFDGTGSTLAYVIATAVLLIFAVGYVTMTKHVPKPGAFYTFIAAGLGKGPGLGAACLATLSYLLNLVGNFAFFGLDVSALISGFDGPRTPWWLWGILCWLVVSIVGYRNIEFSAKVLSLVMALEVAVVLIFDVVVLSHGGSEGLSAAPLSPFQFAQGDIGVTMLFAMMVFMGFEATALFRDEVRAPNKTIPRATYGAVGFVGLLYAVSCYALYSAFGSSASTIAGDAPTNMLRNAIEMYVAPFFSQVAAVLVCTSVFAAALAIHNVTARYTHSVAHDRALPYLLATVHSKHGSPARASNAVAVTGLVVLVLLVVLPLDEKVVYAQLIGVGSLGVLALMALVSCSVITWFARRGGTRKESALRVYVAPAIAGTALVATVIMAVLHFDVLVGGVPGEYTWLVVPLIIVFIFGAMLAYYYRRNKPERYQELGRRH